MKKLFFTFIALLIVFFSAWGIKLRMPINRPNNVQGEQQVAWYETRYTAPTAEEEWTLDPEIPVNYLPVAGEDEVYMVLDDSGNIVGYRHRTQQEDGSWLWTDIEDPNAEHYEKVDGLDHIYKVKSRCQKKTVYNAKLSVFSYRFSRFPMAVTISSDVSRKNGVRNQKLFQKGDGRNLYA